MFHRRFVKIWIVIYWVFLLFVLVLLPAAGQKQSTINRNVYWNNVCSHFAKVHNEMDVVHTFLKLHEKDESYYLNLKGVKADGETLAALDRIQSELAAAQNDIQKLRDEVSERTEVKSNP